MWISYFMTARQSLASQCQSIGWPLTTMNARRVGRQQWAIGTATDLSPEEVVANAAIVAGNKCSWCEGGSVNLILKAAALDALARRNLFNDRQDAIRRFLEAQLTLLKVYKEELIECAAKVTDATFRNNIAEICDDPFIKEAYPRVRPEFLCSLAETITVDLRIQLLQTYMINPYYYRAGWPDLTVLGNEGASFIEVKTTDRLHESQLRFASEVAAPLGLRCQVIQVRPSA